MFLVTVGIALAISWALSKLPGSRFTVGLMRKPRSILIHQLLWTKEIHLSELRHLAQLAVRERVSRFRNKEERPLMETLFFITSLEVDRPGTGSWGPGAGCTLPF